MSDGRTLDILTAISMQVNAGEAVAILGPSGSGKSTLLGLLGCLDLPTDGTIEVDGREIYTAKNLRVGLFTSTDNF
mgnify:CR=1 FL=1